MASGWGEIFGGRTGTTHTECRHCGTNVESGREECAVCGHGVANYRIY